MEDTFKSISTPLIELVKKVDNQEPISIFKDASEEEDKYASPKVAMDENSDELTTQTEHNNGNAKEQIDVDEADVEEDSDEFYTPIKILPDTRKLDITPKVRRHVQLKRIDETQFGDLAKRYLSSIIDRSNFDTIDKTYGIYR